MKKSGRNELESDVKKPVSCSPMFGGVVVEFIDDEALEAMSKHTGLIIRPSPSAIGIAPTSTAIATPSSNTGRGFGDRGRESANRCACLAGLGRMEPDRPRRSSGGLKTSRAA